MIPRPKSFGSNITSLTKGRDFLFWSKKQKFCEGIGAGAADFAGAGVPLKFNSV